MDNDEFDRTVENISMLISNGRIDEAKKKIDKAIDLGYDSKILVKDVCDKSIEKLKVGFINDKIFLPTLIEASDFLAEMMDEMYDQEQNNSRKTIVIGTAMGDIHEIGKNLCAATAKSRGYRVINLGCDVRPDEFIKATKENNAELIAVSAPMSTTRPVQRTVVENAKIELGDVYVLVGGASCTQKWADQINASGYSKDWKEFIQLVDSKIGD